MAAGLAVFAFRSGSVSSQFSRLRGAEPGWLFAAVLAQTASLIAYALIVRVSLRVGAVTARLRTLVRATLGGIAMSASIPGGGVASAAYWYRQLRQEGADAGLAAFAMVGSMLAGVLSLAALLVLGVMIAGGEGPLGGARIPLFACLGATLCLAAISGRTVARVLCSRVPRLREVNSVGRRDITVIAGLALANWLLDCVSLCAALSAVHVRVAPQSILLTYALAQLVASVPLLPGGAGTVEATLVVTFMAFGHTSGNLVSGVLLYRLLACWGLVPVGWIAVLAGREAPALRSVFLRLPRLVARIA